MIPEKPRPNAAETAYRPDLALRQQEGGDRDGLAGRTRHHRAQSADPVCQHAPELPADERAGQQNRQHRRAMRRRDAEVGAECHQMSVRHGHWNAAKERRDADQRQREVRRQAKYAPTLLRTGGQCAQRLCLACRPKEQQRQRHDHHDHHRRIGHHRGGPAVVRDSALEHRRPDDARNVLAGRDQCQSGAASAIEPARDIDHQRRVDRAVAEQADQQTVPDIERPHAAGR